MHVLEVMGSAEIESATTQRLRKSFLLGELFLPGQVTGSYIAADRHLIGAAVPLSSPLTFPSGFGKSLRADSVLARREVAIVNIGGPGRVRFNDSVEELSHCDGLYLGCGTQDVQFESIDASTPAKFYYHCLPAHRSFPSRFVSCESAPKRVVHQSADGGQRYAIQLITPETVETCQVTMGILSVQNGERWVTMPPHTHMTRSEAYCYFDIDADHAVFHFLGAPQQTRHIVARNEQAVFAPGDLVHFAAGTAAFSLVWSMGGENRLIYDDMDEVDIQSIF